MGHRKFLGISSINAQGKTWKGGYNFSMPSHHDTIRTYYEQNTRLFLAFGRSHIAENIHRSLWTNGTKTLDEALNVSNEYILREIESVAPVQARIVDLGCGVGASLIYISARLNEPAVAVGLTLSPIQSRLARQFANSVGLETQVHFLDGDFLSVPVVNESVDAVFSVEAVVHAQEPEKYFQEASRLLKPGGKLILVDDYRSPRSLSVDETKWLNAYVNGWHVPGVVTVGQAQVFATKYQLRLVKNEDLTSQLRLRVLPDTTASALLFLGNVLPIRHAILPSMLGSMALQQCLSMKVIEYRFLVFEKLSPP
jgi:cyclopropane fatty-acyl-phospholipid synthase-like methyltransferase